jgi:hypothetical protein
MIRMKMEKDLHGPQHINDGAPGRRAELAQDQQLFSIYEPPRIISYTDQDILELLGPAQTGGEYGR